MTICRWWQRHQWTKWEISTEYARGKFSGPVQVRRCQRCGLHQFC
jgi:hypothetical protein